MGARRNSNGGVTYNWYGGAARQVEIKALEDHGTFRMVLRKDVPKDEVCINGRFVYTTKHNPPEDGHAKTDAYVDARFCAKGSKVR